MLEQAMPKLREMMAEQGLEMGEGSVSQEQPQDKELGDGQNNGGGQMAQSDELEEADIEHNSAQQVKITNGALGGIDFFA